MVDLQIIDTTVQDGIELDRRRREAVEAEVRRKKKKELRRSKQQSGRVLEREFKFLDKIRRLSKKVSTKELKAKAEKMFGEKKTETGYTMYSAGEFSAALLSILNDRGKIDIEIQLDYGAGKREEVAREVVKREVVIDEEVSLL